MKQNASFVTRSIRAVVQDHDDLPAIHAGFLVLSFLLAAMFRLGFFAMLIAVRVVLDVLKEREVHRRGWAGTLEGVVRAHLIDGSLLLFAWALAMVLHPDILLGSAVGGLPLAIFTVTRGIGVTLPKMKILTDFLHVFFHMESYLREKNRLIGRGLVFSEKCAIVLLGFSLSVLLLLPLIPLISWQEYVRLLLSEAAPWRM